jgi:hypothetical protein
MNKKDRKLCSQDDIFRILDSIEILQGDRRDRKTIYVPKRAYKIAKKMLKIEGKAGEIKIKTY